MKRALVTFILLAVLWPQASCPLRRAVRAPASAVDVLEEEDPSAWAAVVDRALRLRWELEPSRATALGVRGFDDRLPPASGRDLRQAVDRLTKTVQQLYAIEPAQLSRLDQVDRQLLIADLRLLLQELVEEGRPLRSPLEPIEEVIDGVLTLYLQDGLPLDVRLAAIAERLLRLPELLTAVRENLHQPAAFRCRAALKRASALTAFVDGELRALGERAGHDVRERLALGIDEALLGLGAFSTELAPRCTESGEEAPIGADNYARRVRLAHGVAMDAAQVVALAEEWLRRTDDALAQLPAQPRERRVAPPAGFDRQAAFELIATHSGSLRALTLERGLATPPPTLDSMRVIAAPSLMARRAALFSFFPAPMFGVGSALLLVDGLPSGALTLTEREQLHRRLDGNGAVLIAAAETFPGRQLQHLAARRQSSPVRRTYRAQVMLDGWALYAAELALEHGLVTSDEDARRALLEQTRAAAVRALVDAQLHTGVLGFDEAVAWLDERLTAVAAESAAARSARLEREVIAMLRVPARAAAALIGKLELRALRDRAEAKKGAAFDLGRFHDAVLAQGIIPPAYVATLLLREPLPVIDPPIEKTADEAGEVPAVPELEG